MRSKGQKRRIQKPTLLYAICEGKKKSLAYFLRSQYPMLFVSPLTGLLGFLRDTTLKKTLIKRNEKGGSLYPLQKKRYNERTREGSILLVSFVCILCAAPLFVSFDEGSFEGVEKKRKETKRNEKKRKETKRKETKECLFKRPVRETLGKETKRGKFFLLRERKKKQDP